MTINDESLRVQAAERAQLLREQVQESADVLLGDIQKSHAELLKAIDDAKNNEMMELLRGVLTRLDRLEAKLPDNPEEVE